MTGGRLLGAIAGLAVLAALALLALWGGGTGDVPAAGRVTVTTDPVPTTRTVFSGASDPTTTVDVNPLQGCTPDPGVQVTATGEIAGFPPGREVSGVTVVGSSARIEFRIDAPGNRDMVVFRLIYVEGSDVHGWTEVGSFDEGSEVAYHIGTHGLTGWFTLSHSVNASGPATDNPERADIDLIYDRVAGRLVGTVSHPEASFMLDLPAEELARDFFADPQCYPTPEDNPVGPTQAGSG